MNTQPSLPKTLLPFFWRFMRPKWKNLIVVFLCTAVWAIVTTLSPYMLKVVIDRVVTFTGDPAHVWSVAWTPVLVFISVNIALDIAMRVEDFVVLKTIPPIKAEIRGSMFNYIQQHSHHYFQNHLSGTLSNKVLDMVRGFENMFRSVAFVFFPILLHFLFSVILVSTVHWWFGLFFVCWFTLYISVTALFSRTCIVYSDAHSAANSTLSGRIVDAFRNISTVRIFARRQFENSNLDTYQHDEVSKAQKLAKHLLKIQIFQGISSTLLLSIALILFINLWQKGIVTVGDFTFIMSITFSLMIFAWWAAEQFVLFFKEFGVSRQALSLVNIPHEVVDAPNASSLSVAGGKITFENVNFNYIEGKNIFNDKNLSIEAGERVGLVGFSGSGKTTFVNLILRYFDIASGIISIDGQDISEVTQESLRQEIAVIPQDASLFHRSLMENIRYGRENATDAQVIESSKRACCHEFVIELEKGYDSLVGEGGVKLSGGQRQRIAIARAILKNAPILILDEATSALDSVTERKIQKSLAVAMEGKTTIVIAHRLSTLSMLDRILVFDEGAIIESGTHEELLKKNGHYSLLWKMQTDGFLPNEQKG